MVTLPRPAPGWVRMITVSGLLPSGSASLARTLMVVVPPWLAAVSLLATGAWFGLTLTVTSAGSEASPLLSRAM
ncbi:hypothetical protein D3C78_1831740 [compost metagenome]